MDKTWILDLDDTLYLCHPDYSISLFEAGLLMVKELGRHALGARDLLNMHYEIDKKEVKKRKFGSIRRFPDSFVFTYRSMCKKGKIKPRKLIEKKLYEIGMQTFSKENHSKGLLPGARETLDFLVGQGDKLILLTKGNPRVQNEKIDLNHIRHYFSKIKIERMKDADIFRKLSKGHKNVISVGDSKPTDIKPSIKAGLKTIYIPSNTWGLDEGKLPKSKLLTVYQDITDIIKNYDKL